MNKQQKMKKLFLDFCNKNGLRVEEMGCGDLGAYIPSHYFTDNEERDEVTFMEYSDRCTNPSICFETCVDCYYDALNSGVTIEFDTCNSRNIYKEKDFKLVEETYKNIIAKLEFFNVLIKEMKINERKKSLEQDFQKETKGRR